MHGCSLYNQQEVDDINSKQEDNSLLPRTNNTKSNEVPAEDAEEKKPFNCTHCDKKFSTKSKLRKHLRYHNLKNITYECPICNQIFPKKIDLKRHLEEVHEGKCPECNTKFSHVYELINHVQLGHEGKKPHNCSLCKKSFAKKSYLKNHTKFVHEGRKPHKCSHCGTSFSKRGKLKRHFDSMHGKLKCSKCNFGSPSIMKLTRHITVVHGKNGAEANGSGNGSSQNGEESAGDRKRKNEDKKDSVSKKAKLDEDNDNIVYLDDDVVEVEEGRSPAKEAELAAATGGATVAKPVTKEGKKPYECSICNKSFPHKSWLKKHIESVHEGKKRHNCSYCHKIFFEKRKLKKHIQTVHKGKNLVEDEKDSVSKKAKLDQVHEFEYECPNCNETFNLKKHLDSHLSKCNKITNQQDVHDLNFEQEDNSLLPKTNDTKSNEVPAQDAEGKMQNNSIIRLLSLNYCPHCDKKFSDKRELKMHLKSESLYEYECLNCDEAFHLKKQLDSHLSKYHKITNQQEDNSLSIETSMPRTSNTKSNEVPAQKAEGKKPHTCSHCEKSFPKKSKLKRHFDAIHGKDIKHKCSKCNFGTNSIMKWTHHIKGQLISKCPYEKSVSSKIPTNFCTEIFCSFVGASCRLPYL